MPFLMTGDKESFAQALSDMGNWHLFIKIGILISLSITVLTVGYWIIIVKQKTDLEVAQKEEQALRHSFESQYPLAASLEDYQNQLDAVNVAFEQLMIYFSKKSDIPTLLDELIQGSAELTFQQIKLLPEDAVDFYNIQPIEFSVIGSYEHLVNFIGKVAAFSKMMTIHDVVIRAKKEDPLSYLLINISAKMYYSNTEQAQ